MSVILIGIGIVIGSAVTILIFCYFIMGTLRIIEDEFMEGPYLFLELSKDMSQVITKKYVVFRVSRK